MSVIRQVLATVIISFMCITMGIMYTWPSSTYKLFGSTNTTLDRVMTNTELSLLGSLSSISALIIVPFSGFLLDWLGRKRTFVMFSMAQVLAWVVVVFSKKVEAILAAICLSGLSGCVVIVIPMYVCEICEDSIRGSMASVTMTFYNIGTLVSYLFGGFLEYKIMNYLSLSLTVLGLVMLSYIRESPLFLMKKGLEKEAAAAIAFYKSTKVSSKEVINELNKIKQLLNPTLDGEVPLIQKSSPEEVQTKQKLSHWQFLKKSRATRKALFVCLTLFTAAIFQGLVVVQVYAAPLFDEAVPSMPSMWTSVLFAIISVISGFFGAYLVESIGRRKLMIISSSVAGIFCVILGTQIQLKWAPHWLTAVFIYLYCVAYCLGAGIVPFVLLAEAFLPEIKSFASIVSIEWAFICNFIILFIFNPIVTNFGLGSIFYIFSIWCFLSAVFCVKFLPETKGLTIDAIQVLFTKQSHK